MKTITFYCGQSPEYWDGDTTAIGGSEKAVIAMAQELQLLGLDVTVYGEANGVYNGVKYIPHTNWHPGLSTDVLVSWRTLAPFVTKFRRPAAKTTVLWLHDLGLPTVPAQYSAHIDKVAVLSKFHANSVTCNNPQFKEKIWYVKNGLDFTFYPANLPSKRRNSYFYSSSPRRGLGRLLKEWPSVLVRYPDARLHVAYGFELSIAMSQKAGLIQDVNVYKMLQDKVNNTPGVTYHGRLSQEKLAEVQRSCEAWLYPPSDFEETFCITALEAQAAYCVPITRLNGALPEVVLHPIEWIAGMTTLDAVNAIEFNTSDLNAARKHAEQHTWANEAARWVKELF